MSQIATRKDRPPSATLFSSKDGRSASKAEIGSTAGQHGAEKAGGHLSTQDRYDAGYGVDLDMNPQGFVVDLSMRGVR